MHKNSIIVIGLLLLCIGTAHGWDAEGGFEEGESYEIIWYDEYNMFGHKIPNEASVYSQVLYTARCVCFTIKSFFYDLVGIDITYDVDKYEWNGDSYEETDSASFSIGITHEANHTETYISTFDPVEEYFKGNETRKNEWDGDSDHPDVLNVSVTIDGDGDSLDDSNYGYVTVSDATANQLCGGNVDYGFGTGKGSDGGSGSIYQGLRIGDDEGTGDMGNLFERLFWILIPLIFLLCVFQLILRAL